MLKFTIPDSFPDMLELYFEKNWALPDKIVMIPKEEAAIVTFSDPKGFSFSLPTDVLPTECILTLKQMSRSLMKLD